MKGPSGHSSGHPFQTDWNLFLPLPPPKPLPRESRTRKGRECLQLGRPPGHTGSPAGRPAPSTPATSPTRQCVWPHHVTAHVAACNRLHRDAARMWCHPHARPDRPARARHDRGPPHGPGSQTLPRAGQRQLPRGNRTGGLARSHPPIYLVTKSAPSDHFHLVIPPLTPASGSLQPGPFYKLSFLRSHPQASPSV